MDELKLSTYNFEEKQPASFAELLRDSVREVFGGAAGHGCDDKNTSQEQTSQEHKIHKHKSQEHSSLPLLAAGAALSLAAIAGWKQILPRLARRAELNTARLQGTSMSELSNLLEQKARIELDSGYRYFQQTRGGRPQIYRWPDNGLSLEKQSLLDVERYSNGVWKTSQKEDLIHELAKGWFHEKTDEISMQRAIELLSR